VCSPLSGSVFPFGTTQVCCTATDHNGNSAQCCFNVTVVDSTPPAITCPADINRVCTGPDGKAVTFTTTATDVCDPSPTIVCVPASGSTFPIGTTQVCCTATDHSHNSSQCCFNITIFDNRPPAITCPTDITAECTSPAGAPVSFTVTATDTCDPNPTIACDHQSGSTFPFGTTPVCCTATDHNGNSAQCCFNVTVVDHTPPTITCPADISRQCTGPDGKPVQFTVTATDLCDPAPTIVCDHTSGSTFPIGTTTVCCTASDHSGNSAQCCFHITIIDSRPPAITCPPDLTVECTSPNGAPATYTATATDTCDPNPTIACTPPSGSSFPFGTTQVCCTATDHNGNSAQCCFNVTVVDTTPPAITCPADMNRVCTGPDGKAITFTTTATDLCDPSPTIVCVPPSGSTFPIGTTQVCCTATDHSNNSSQCCFNITIFDNRPPSITCPPDITAECTRPAGKPVTFTVTATDTCDPDPTIVCNPPSGSNFPQGTTQVCCTATDHNNNSAQCCFNVTIVDTTAPEITCPGDITVDCTGPNGAPATYTATAVDRCDSSVTVTCDPPSGTTFPTGTTQVCCTARDDAGNTAQCCFNVNVVDRTPPTLQCPDNITISVHDVPEPPVVFAPSTSDLCDTDPMVQCDPPSGTVFPPGCTTVVCMATDHSGNTALCHFEVCIMTCVGFDATSAGEVPADTFISNQYEPLGLHLEGLSDTGFPGVLARRQGPPGSTTDDLVPTSAPNYLQTNAGDGTSDSGLITFTFVDPVNGTPRTSSYAQLTFMDIEGSGSVASGGSGRTKLSAYDPNGALVGQVLVPRSPANAGHFTASIGAIGGPLRIAMVVAEVGSPTDSGGVDEFCYALNPPDVSLSVMVSDPIPTLGETFHGMVFLRNNTGQSMSTNYEVFAGFSPTRPKRYLQHSTPVVLTPNFNRFGAPFDYPMTVPGNRPRLVGRTVYLVATIKNPITNALIVSANTPFVVRAAP
ncbi:MAG: HYR domain-containing protein, partial [Planctomycetes bacterium]|nr:HYR domain-containing protein [Planctomycetota bacterium]